MEVDLSAEERGELGGELRGFGEVESLDESGVVAGFLDEGSGFAALFEEGESGDEGERSSEDEEGEDPEEAGSETAEDWRFIRHGFGGLDRMCSFGKLAGAVCAE